MAGPGVTETITVEIPQGTAKLLRLLSSSKDLSPEDVAADALESGLRSGSYRDELDSIASLLATTQDRTAARAGSRRPKTRPGRTRTKANTTRAKPARRAPASPEAREKAVLVAVAKFEPATKSQVMEATGISEHAWKTQIAALKADRKVKQTGNRRAATYTTT